MDYRLKASFDADANRTADSVVENEEGVWLADYDPQSKSAIPLSDGGGYYLPAPSNWRDLILPAETDGED